MPGRSPHRRSTPPPPLLSRHSPGRGRVRSPEPRHLQVASSSRDRDRKGEYWPTVRRSRSPVPPKGRTFSPPKKRKSSPIQERRISRRKNNSKSPVGSRSGSRDDSESNPRSSRSLSDAERFGGREYEKHFKVGGPQFRGPEESIVYKINDLKMFTIEVMRKPSSMHDDSSINRSIINPDEISPVRRPDEGLRPMFSRILTTSSKDGSRFDDHQRIITIDNSRGSAGRDKPHSQERPPARFSPSPGPSHYKDHRRPYYPARERAHSPYETSHRSPLRDEYVVPKDKHGERRGGSKEYSRRELDVRKREERRYSSERRPSYEQDHRESESDLRSRINEKRSGTHPHSHIKERERRYEGAREWRGRSHHKSPPHERRRPEHHEESHDQRKAWERDMEWEGRGRGRKHSREPREYPDHYEESRRPPSSYKNNYEFKKFNRNPQFGVNRFPPPVRGRGRGLVGRGLQQGFRGGLMGPRGLSRGFPPRFFPPY